MAKLVKPKKEVIVGVRLPPSLVSELRSIAKEEHYLDVSELLRAIIRAQAREYGPPRSNDIQQVVSEIRGEISKSESDQRKKIVAQLQALLEEMQR